MKPEGAPACYISGTDRDELIADHKWQQQLVRAW